LPLPLLVLLPSLTAGVIITQTSTSTFTSAAASPASTIVETAAAPNPTSTSEQYTSDSVFQSTVLNSTNFYRSEHNATSLTWNSSLSSFALSWAQKCQWAHSHGPNGENLAENYENVTDAIDGWGDERGKYDFSHGGFGEGTGHFTQLVWKATTSVGCARVNCANNDKGGNAQGWYVVCEYWPPGNVMGQFAKEVQSEIDKFKAHGKGEAAKYVAYIYDKLNGAEGRRRWSWGSMLVVGLTVVMSYWL